MALFLILAPFATFATLMLLTTVKISLAASALVAFGLVLRDMIEGRSIKMLPIGTLVIFTSLAGYHFIAAAEMSPTSVRLAVDGSVLAIALVSIAIRLPFTIQHAREVVDAETAKLPHFMRTNYILTWVAELRRIDVGQQGSRNESPIAFAARNTATYFTKWYPKHVRAGIAASANAAAA